MLRWLSDRLPGHAGIGAADRKLLREARNRALIPDRNNGHPAAITTTNSDAELRALFNAMSDLVMVIDRSGMYVSMAPTNFPDSLRPDELIGRNICDAWPAETADAFLRLIIRVITTGKPEQIEYQRPDVQDRWESATISRLSDDRVVLVARDVTDLKRNEQILAEREAELRALFSAMTDTVVSVSREGRCVGVAPTNPNQPHRYGATLLGKVLEDVLPQARAAEFRETIQRCLDTQQSADVEYTLGERDDIDWYRATISPAGPDTVVWVARNVTAEKRDEHIIAEREAEMRAVFAAMSDVVFVMSREGEYLRAAPTIPALTDAYQNRTAWVIGRRVADVLAPPMGDDGLAAIRAALDSGQTQSFDYRVDYAPGDFRWYSASISPMTDDTVVWVARDVTRRRRDQELMAEREQQYRSIFESTSDALFITDMEDRIVDANPAACAMHGYTLEELRELAPFALVHPTSRARTDDYLQTLAAGKPFRGRSINVRKDGSTFVSESLGTPITYRGKPHILSIERDITDQVQSERLLEQRVADRTREVTSLLHVAQNVTSTLDLDQLIVRINDELQRIVGYSGASLLIVEGNDLVIRHSRPVSEGALGVRFPLNTDSALTVMMSGQSLIVDDVRAEGTLAEGFRALLGDRIELPAFRNVRSWAGIPMMLHDRIVGLISMSHVEPGYFTQEHVRLAQGFASHAAIAVENARLFEESRVRARELASLLRVSQAVASTLDLRTLAHLILEEMVTVADYTGATLAAVQNDELLILDSWGPYREEVIGGPTARIPLRNVPRQLWQTMEDGKPLVIDDTEDESREAQLYRRMFGPFLHTPAFTGIRSWLLVPLLRQGAIIGMLTAAHDEPAHFTPDRVNLVAAAASQAAVAIENARLYEEEQLRTRELTALIEISKDVTSELELRPLLSTVLDEMRTIVDYNRASIMVREGEALVVLDSRLTDGRPGDEPVGMRIPLDVAGALWERVEHGEAVFIDNVRDEEDRLAASYRTIAGPALETAFRDVRSWLGVPLALKDGVIGALTLSKDEAGFYNERHAQLAMTVANQAAVAIENARLFEQAEERSRELAALLDVSHTVVARLDVDGLVNLILDQLRTIIDYTGASVTLLDGEEFSIVASRSVGGDSAVGIRIPVASAEPLWQRILRLESILIDDVRSDEPAASEYRAIFGRGIDTGPFRDIRSWMAVPLAPKDQAIGTLTISHTEPGHFTERHVHLLRAVADQAAVAIENARLFEEAQQRARETQALLRADQELFRSLDLDAVLQSLVDVAVDVLRADKSIVILHHGDVDVVRAARNYSEETLTLIRNWLPNMPHVEPAPGEAKTVVHEDLADAPEFIRITLAGENIASQLSIPIHDDTRTFGMFGVGFVERHKFTADEQRLFAALGERAAIAIKNAELYERAQQAASLEERQRLARELHDSVSQALYGIALGARTARTQLDREPSRAVEPVDYVLSLAEAGLAEMRALIFELRPESLELEGLVAGLEKQAAALRARHGVEVEAELCAEPDVPMPVKEAVSRIAQEALHNTVKHARASRVTLRLTRDERAITLEVQDNGRGFDPQQTFAGHLGLRSMRERAANLGGTIEIKSGEGAGARIRVSIPTTPAQASPN